MTYEPEIVSKAPTKKYRDGWERLWGKKKAKPKPETGKEKKENEKGLPVSRRP